MARDRPFILGKSCIRPCLKAANCKAVLWMSVVGQNLPFVPHTQHGEAGFINWLLASGGHTGRMLTLAISVPS